MEEKHVYARFAKSHLYHAGTMFIFNNSAVGQMSVKKHQIGLRRKNTGRRNVTIRSGRKKSANA